MDDVIDDVYIIDDGINVCCYICICVGNKIG